MRVVVGMKRSRTGKLHGLWALSHIGPEVMIEELPAIVRIKAQQRKRQALLDLTRGFNHPGGAFIPYGPAFGPAAYNIRIGQTPNEITSQAATTMGHAVGLQ